LKSKSVERIFFNASQNFVRSDISLKLSSKSDFRYPANVRTGPFCLYAHALSISMVGMNLYFFGGAIKSGYLELII